MLAITVPALTGCEYGCVEADFGAKNLIFVLTPEGVFESTYPLDDVTPHPLRPASVWPRNAHDESPVG